MSETILGVVNLDIGEYEHGIHLTTKTGKYWNGQLSILKPSILPF